MIENNKMCKINLTAWYTFESIELLIQFNDGNASILETACEQWPLSLNWWEILNFDHGWYVHTVLEFFKEINR